MIKLAIVCSFIKSLSVLGGRAFQPVNGEGERSDARVCAAERGVYRCRVFSKPDVGEAEKLMRVLGVFLTQCWFPVGNFR